MIRYREDEKFPNVVYNSLLKQRFINIKNEIFDLYYEISLTCNKNTQLCRQIVSFKRILRSM